MLFPALSQIVAGFALTAGGLFAECPRAVITCQKSSENASQYLCSANANQPSPKNRPQYSWTVSHGRITDDATRGNVTIDVGGAEAESMLVTLKVKWTKLSRNCDFSGALKVSLR